MNTSSCIGISTMKPCCRILIGYRISSIFGVSHIRSNHKIVNNSSKLHSKSKLSCYNDAKCKVIGHKKGVIDLNRRAFFASGSNWGESKILGKNKLGVNKDSSRGILVIPHVASDFRNHSTSIDSHVNEKGFESIYIQGSLNVKPLVIEKIENGNEVVKEDESRVQVNGSGVNLDILKDLNENVETESEASNIEKEAWKLLRDAVVNYCGNPVGTVAANNPADKQPLNYDQVFIRDFVPSALAFLLNGEGEIVKNFLLNTLQLQVTYDLNLMLCWDINH